MAIGDPSLKEQKCLDNLKEWQAGLEFAEKWGGAEWPRHHRLEAGATKKSYDPKTMSRTVALRLGLIGG